MSSLIIDTFSLRFKPLVAIKRLAEQINADKIKEQGETDAEI